MWEIPDNGGDTLWVLFPSAQSRRPSTDADSTTACLDSHDRLALTRCVSAILIYLRAKADVRGAQAYDRLTPALAKFLEGLTALHDGNHFHKVAELYVLPTLSTRPG